MTYDEFFKEAKRLNLRMPMNHADMCAAFDAKDAEIARLRVARQALQDLLSTCTIDDGTTGLVEAAQAALDASVRL